MQHEADVDTSPIQVIEVYLHQNTSIQCQLGKYNIIYSTVTLYTLAALAHAHLISYARMPHQ